MAVNQEKMLQTLYDSLFAVFTGKPPGGEAGSEAERMLMVNAIEPFRDHPNGATL